MAQAPNMHGHHILSQESACCTGGLPRQVGLLFATADLIGIGRECECIDHAALER
jgi:hypothetical protein